MWSHPLLTPSSLSSSWFGELSMAQTALRSCVGFPVHQNRSACWVVEYASDEIVSVWKPSGACPELKQEHARPFFSTKPHHLPALHLSLFLFFLSFLPSNLLHTNLPIFSLSLFLPVFFSALGFSSFFFHIYSYSTTSVYVCVSKWPIFSLASRQWHTVQADYFVFKAHENNGACVLICGLFSGDVSSALCLCPCPCSIIIRPSAIYVCVGLFY